MSTERSGDPSQQGIRRPSLAPVLLAAVLAVTLKEASQITRYQDAVGKRRRHKGYLKAKPIGSALTQAQRLSRFVGSEQVRVVVDAFTGDVALVYKQSVPASPRHLAVFCTRTMESRLLPAPGWDAAATSRLINAVMGEMLYNQFGKRNWSVSVEEAFWKGLWVAQRFVNPETKPAPIIRVKNKISV